MPTSSSHPGVARVVCAALLGRLPTGMAPLATVLLLRDEGRSYAVAGRRRCRGIGGQRHRMAALGAARRSHRAGTRVVAARVRLPGRLRSSCAARHARRAGHCADRRAPRWRGRRCPRSARACVRSGPACSRPRACATPRTRSRPGCRRCSSSSGRSSPRRSPSSQRRGRPSCRVWLRRRSAPSGLR